MRLRGRDNVCRSRPSYSSVGAEIGPTMDPIVMNRRLRTLIIEMQWTIGEKKCKVKWPRIVTCDGRSIAVKI